MAPLSLPRLKNVFQRWQNGLHGQGWNSLFLDNHDLPRIVSRWGDDGLYRERSAKMLATMIHGMEGTPYIYQGEELAMTNIRLPLEEYDDIETKNLYSERIARGYSHESVMNSIYARGRDNARTPMQWTDGENAGFTSGKPWLPVNPNHAFINAAQQVNDPNSVYHYYRQLIALRKEQTAIQKGTFTLLCPDDERVFAYTRDTEQEHILVVCNFSGEETAFVVPEAYRSAETLIENMEASEGVLKPYEARMLKR